MPGGEPIERLVDVAELFTRITCLAKLVAPGVGQRGDPIADGHVGVVA